MIDRTKLVQAVDVSHYQGQIDWPKMAAAGIKVAIVKATQGMAVDPMWETNRKGAEAAGIIVLW